MAEAKLKTETREITSPAKIRECNLEQLEKLPDLKLHGLEMKTVCLNDPVVLDRAKQQFEFEFGEGVTPLYQIPHVIRIEEGKQVPVKTFTKRYGTNRKDTYFDEFVRISSDTEEDTGEDEIIYRQLIRLSDSLNRWFRGEDG